MKYLIFKDKKRRQLFFKNEIYFYLFKSLLKNNKINKSYRFLLSSKLVNFNKDSFKTRLVNRCIFTGRRYILNKKYRLSRLQLPEIVNSFFLKGFTRSGW